MNPENTIPSSPSSPSLPSIPSQSDKSVKFTPGPWDYTIHECGLGNLFKAKFIVTGNNYTIAGCYCANRNLMPEFERNAALIAAAPEMFSALMEVLNWYNAFTPHATGRMFVPDDMIEKVLKAIQKARGEK